MSLIKVETAFQFQDRPDDDHLYVVISDPQQPRVVLVSLTTKRRFTDTACELTVGDHPFVQHDSCVAYEYAEIVEVAAIEAKIATGDIRLREEFGKEMILRIWEGAERTRNLSNRCTEILRGQSLIS
jgi:hypothetical protein